MCETHCRHIVALAVIVVFVVVVVVVVGNDYAK